MKKSLILGVAATAGISAVLATGKLSDISGPQGIPEQTAGEGIGFFAAMNMSDEWVSGIAPDMKYGIYSFSADGSGFTACSPVSTAKVSDAAFYHDGKYYSVVVPSSATYLKYSATLDVYDTDTWTVGDSKEFDNKTNTYAHDMTYDYTGSTVYAVSTDGYNTLNPGYATLLKTMDINSGEMTTIGKNGCRLYALSADADGRLWGVGVPLDVNTPTRLYTVDKTTGAATAVADLDINIYTASSSSSTFDYRSGKLYLVARSYIDDANSSRTYQSAVYEVNTSTGATTVVWEFPTSEILAGLVIKDSHPKAPQAVNGLEFTFDTGSITSGKVKFTLPEYAYDRSQLSGQLKAEIYVDGQLVEEAASLTPGAGYTSSKSFDLPAGSTHKVRVFCYKDGLKSLPADTDVYSGADTPEKPGDLTVTANSRGDKVNISWSAPQTGSNGGYIDRSKLTYDIVLKPDNKTIATGITSTSFDYTFTDRKMGISQFVVTPRIDTATGTPAASPVLLLGSAWPVPYLEDFNYTDEAYWPFSKIDANGDASDEWGFQWYFDPTRRSAWYYTTPNPNKAADDWLITPSINLDHNSVYSLQFDTYGYMGGVNTFEVTIGAEATVASQKTVILGHTYNTAAYSVSAPLSVGTQFVPAEGDIRIGFHNISEGSDHMFIDNIYVDYYGPVTIPGLSTGISLTKHDGKVDIKFNAPSVSAGGENLSSLSYVKIFRTSQASDAIATFDNPAPGAELSFTDNSPIPGIARYVIVAANSAGTGLETIASIDTNADVPRAVENLTVTERNDWTEAVISWNYPESMTGVNGLPLDEGDITYDVYRQIDFTTTLIAQNLSECSYVDTDCAASFPDGRQQYPVTYKVVAHTSGGEGETAASEQKLMGRSYGLPFHESWTDQQVDNYPWRTANLSGFASWSVSGNAYDPMTSGQDGYGLASFSIASSSTSGTGDYVSPRIDVSDHANPVLSFYLFHSDDSKTINSSLQVGFETEESVQWLDGIYYVYDSEPGWREYKVTVPEGFASSSRLSVIFRGHATTNKGCVHIDNVNITGDQPEHEIKACGITGPEKCLIGHDNVYGVEVQNIGSEDMDNVTVSFYVDDNLISSSTIDLVAAGETSVQDFTFTPGLDNTERQLQLHAVVSAGKDTSADNNEIETTVSLVAPMLPYVTDLSGSDTNGAAVLSWSDATIYPHVEYVTDNVSQYDAFAIDKAGDWKFVDCDGEITVQIQEGGTLLSWDHVGEPQAFIVFNPTLANAGNLISPRSGSQCFISFAARNANDDWMISPQLSGEAQTISFFAKCAHYNDLNERFEVWASSTTPDLGSFTCISGTDPVSVGSSTQWTKFNYNLPAGTRYFAIRCVSVGQTGLMIDDITYSPVYPSVELWGFNVYRDGGKITSEPYGDFTFTDTDVTVGQEYVYNVSAVYDSGESIFSNPVTVTVSGSGIVNIYGEGISIKATPTGVNVTNACGKAIYVYSVDGRQVYGIIGTGADFLPLDSGIYIVKAGDASAKVAVR